MNARAEAAQVAESVRGGCAGVVPLEARLEAWQLALCERPARLAEWIDHHGSPLNVLNPAPFSNNADELRREAAGAGVSLQIFFARKANKALTFVDAAQRSGLGVDVASEQELGQVLARGVPSKNVVVTAAIKPKALLELCVSSGATVVIDNRDELLLLAGLARGASRPVPIAFRLAPIPAPGRAPTRFGLPAHEIVELARQCPTIAPMAIHGVHFHLDGYDAADRVAALAESLELVDALREIGHQAKFIDMGGGVPISYLADGSQWERFWSEHTAAVRGDGAPLTFEGHGLGLSAHAGQILGRANVYPYFQAPTRGDWLARVLYGKVDAGERTVAGALRMRGLQLRCEPGRALLDGCGLTAARVEFRKQRQDGTWLIGLAMNRTQCRSTSDDFLVDPLLLRPGQDESAEIEGYLVGAYCIERELLTWRRLRFPRGVQVGDIAVFPNTAGYLMHILESSSHQMPLARNLVAGSLDEPELDPIDIANHER